MWDLANHKNSAAKQFDQEILIFAMMFTATRDVVTSTLMTAAFVILLTSY